MVSGYTEDGKADQNLAKKNAEKGERKKSGISKNTDTIFETSKITDWIKTKPSPVLNRVREREKKASEKWNKRLIFRLWRRSFLRHSPLHIDRDEKVLRQSLV